MNYVMMKILTVSIATMCMHANVHVLARGHMYVFMHVLVCLCLFPLTYSHLHKFYLIDKIGKPNMTTEKDTIEVFRNFDQSHNY